MIWALLMADTILQVLLEFRSTRSHFGLAVKNSKKTYYGWLIMAIDATLHGNGRPSMSALTEINDTDSVVSLEKRVGGKPN